MKNKNYAEIQVSVFQQFENMIVAVCFHHTMTELNY